MRIGACLTVAALLALVPAANAQSDCNDIMKYVTMAGSSDGFTPLLSGRSSGSWGSYEVESRLVGAKSCSVSGFTYGQYSCFWSFDNAEAADVAFDEITATLKGCLESWTVSNWNEDFQNPARSTYRKIFKLNGELDSRGNRLDWNFTLEKPVQLKDKTVWSMSSRLSRIN